jgi:erythromycin esterase-like protein
MPPSSDDNSPVTRLRRSLQAGAAFASYTATTAAGRPDVVGKVVRTGQTGGRRLKDTTVALGTAVNRGVGRAARSLTLGEYREEVDRALAEASEVIAAQAAQISALEARLEALDTLGDRGGRDDG